MKAYLEPQDIDKLIAVCNCVRDQIAIRLLFRLGCRVSELNSIEHEKDIDWADRLISIRHLKKRTNLHCPQCNTRLAKTAKFCPGCGQTVTSLISAQSAEEHRRRIRIDQETLDAIKDYLQRRQVKDKRLMPLSRQRIYAIVRQAAAAAGLDGKILQIEELTQDHYISPHRLRDAHAVTWLKRRDSLESQRALQQQLGHQSFATTMKYRKMASKELSEIYDSIWNQ